MDSTNRHTAKFLERAHNSQTLQEHTAATGIEDASLFFLPICSPWLALLCVRLEVGFEAVPGVQVGLYECAVVQRFNNCTRMLELQIRLHSVCIAGAL